METQIATWVRMYEDVHAQDTYSLGLPAFIAGEFARLVTLECDIRLTGTRGKWMDEQFSVFRDSLRPSVEYAARWVALYLSRMCAAMPSPWMWCRPTPFSPLPSILPDA